MCGGQNKGRVIQNEGNGGDEGLPFIYVNYLFQMAAKLFGHSYLLSCLDPMTS